MNGLVGAPVCPTFDDVATAVPTVVRHAEALDIVMVRPDGERVTIAGDELAGDDAVATRVLSTSNPTRSTLPLRPRSGR